MSSSENNTSRDAPAKSGVRLFRLLTLILAIAIPAVAVILIVIYTFPEKNVSEQIAAWTASGEREKAAEPAGWERVADDTAVLHMPYFQLLKRTEAADTDKMKSDAASDFAFSQLALKPWQFREKLLRVEGQVINVCPVYPQRDQSEWEGVSSEQLPSLNIYQTEIVKLVNGNVTEKYFLHTISFPEHLTPGDKVIFCGYFYSLYKGKEIPLKEGGTALVVAPLLVGRMIEPAGAERAREAIPADILSGMTDRAEMTTGEESAVPAALDAMKSVNGVSDATYFDLYAAPEKYRGCVVRLSGEVSRVDALENMDVPEGLKKYRRIILTIGKDTPFTRYAAAYLSPDVPELKQMQVVTLRGVFIKDAQMEGGRDKTAVLPLIASSEAESVGWAKTPEMNPWLRFLLAGIIIFAAVAMVVAVVLFHMIRKDKRAELKHHQVLRDITSKMKMKDEE